MTSGKLLSELRLRLIDGCNIRDHWHIKNDDQCFFLREYTPGKGHHHNSTNSLILNLKKSVRKKCNQNEFRYKEKAIQICSAEIARSLGQDLFGGATFVPIPPSKARDHPEYDDRMLKICSGILTSVQFSINVREFVNQPQTIRTAHLSTGNRPSIEEIANSYVIDERKVDLEPSKIVVVDDVLTTGAHFKAMQRVLQDRFPGVSLLGLFIARCVPQNNNFLPIDLE